MALYDMTKVNEGLQATKESLIKLNRTTFAEENIHERTHLQAALRNHIDLIDEDGSAGTLPTPSSTGIRHDPEQQLGRQDAWPLKGASC